MTNAKKGRANGGASEIPFESRNPKYDRPFFPALEQDLQCKLNQPGVGGGTGDHPERRSGVSSETWICELRMIENVEELRPKLHGLFLMNARHFRE